MPSANVSLTPSYSFFERLQIPMAQEMKMQIVLLGWGSLVWREGMLPLQSSWRSDGPMLPLEFARTSRDMRLTLVLTETAVPVPTLWAELGFKTLEAACEALAEREGCGTAAIGRWPGTSSGHPIGAECIATWATEKQIDAVIWTALKPKFDGVNGIGPASSQEAVTYLRELEGEAALRAEEYVRRAPNQVRTTYRAAIESQLGWWPTEEP